MKQRLIDANALDRNFYDSCTGECDCCSLHNTIEYGVYGCGLIHLAPTIDAVPFERFAGVCKHANISCVDPDNRVFDRVCLHTRPAGKSWGTCSFENCPIIAKMDGGADP